MDIDATQAIDLSDFDDETDEKTDELERTPVGYLKVLSNREFQETTFPVYEGENFIGRDVSNSVAIPVKSLSKQHACIEVQTDTHLVYDLGSRNKTRKEKLFLKPKVRYNIQHNDKIMLADMSCQYFFASQYEKSQKGNDSGSDTDSELMLGDVDSDPSLLLPQLEDAKESDNSDSHNLSDCIQPTQAVNSDSRSNQNDTLQMKTPAAPRVGGVLAADSDEDSPEKKGAEDVSRVQESGSDTDVEAYANETEDFMVDGDDLAMAATQACNLQELPTQPTNNAKATLTYDPDSDEESDDDTRRGRSLYEAETQAAPGGLAESDEDDDEEAAGKSLYEAETQVAQGDDSECDRDEGDDKAGGRSLYEAETQVAQGGGSGIDSDDEGGGEVRGRSLYEAETQAVSDEDAIRGVSLYEAATQAVNLDDSDDGGTSKKRVSMASTVQLDLSSDLESSGKRPRQSMSPTKTSLMRATKNRVRTISEELRESPDLKETVPPQKLQDIKVDHDESESTDIIESEELAKKLFVQFEESTEETLPCSDFEEATQEMLDLEDQRNGKKQEQAPASIEDHLIPVTGNNSEKPADVTGSLQETKDILPGTSGESPSRSDETVPNEEDDKPSLNRSSDIVSAMVHRGEETVGDKTKRDGSEEKGSDRKVISENVSNVCDSSVVGEPTLPYDLHHSLSDKSKDSQESIRSENAYPAAAPTIPYQLVKSLTKSSSGSSEDVIETLVQPIEGEMEEVSHKGEGENESTEETQAYGEDDTEPMGEEQEGEKETASEGLGVFDIDVDATQQYGEEDEKMVPLSGEVNQTDEVAMATDATQAYGAEDDGDGVTETQVYGADGDECVPDSQEGEQAVTEIDGANQRDSVFAEELVAQDDDGNMDNKVEIDAAPQRRKSGDEGILKKRKGSIPSTSSDEKVGLLSSLKKKVRFGKGNSASQSSTVIASSRSSSRSSHSSVGSNDEEFEVITGDEMLEGDEDAPSEDVSSVSEEKVVRGNRSSRKRKVATTEKPNEEDVKKMKAVIDEENDREKGEKESTDAEKDGSGGGGRKSSRKRKTATIEKPDLTQLSSPDLDSKGRDTIAESDTSARRSCRKVAAKRSKEEEAVEEDENNNHAKRKMTGRSKVTTPEEGIRDDPDGGKQVKGSLRGRKGKQPAAMDEVSSTRRSARGAKSQPAAGTDDLMDDTRDTEKEDGKGKGVETKLNVESLVDESIREPSKRNTRSVRGKMKEEGASNDEKKKSTSNTKRDKEQVKEEPQVLGRGSKRGRTKEKETGEAKDEVPSEKEEEVPRTSRRGKRRGKEEADIPQKKSLKVEEPLEEGTIKEHEGSKVEEEDVPRRGGRRGRSKRQEAEAVVTTPSSSQTRTRGKYLVRADEIGGGTPSLKGTSQKGQNVAEDDEDTSGSSATMSLGSQSLPDIDSDATFVQPEPVKGKRGGRRKTPAVSVEDTNTTDDDIAGKLQGGPSTMRRGRGQRGHSVNAVNTPETSSPSNRSTSSKTASQESSSKSPRSSPNLQDPGSSPSLRRRSSELKPKVMFTGVIDKSGEKIVTSLGGELVDSVFDCTHLVTDKVRRTVKFLCCLSRGALIVTPEWLEQSKKQQRFIDAKDFMLSDKDAEKQHKFNLSKSYEKANKGALLSRWKVHTTPNVKPEPSQMKDIIKSAGGEILSRVPCQHQDCTIVISCEVDSSKCLPAVAADIPIVTAEFLLTGLLRQEIDLEEYRLSMATMSSPAKTTTKPSTPSSKTRSRRR